MLNNRNLNILELNMLGTSDPRCIPSARLNAAVCFSRLSRWCRGSAMGGPWEGPVSSEKTPLGNVFCVVNDGYLCEKHRRPAFKNKNSFEICGKLRCLNGSEFCASIYSICNDQSITVFLVTWVAQLNLAPWGNRFARAARKCFRKMLEVWRLCICALAVGCRWKEINAVQEIIGLTIQMYSLYLKFLMCQFQKCIQIWSNMVVPCVFCIPGSSNAQNKLSV